MEAINKLKYRFKQSGIVEQLIYINVGVFLLVFITNTFTFLFQSETNFFLKFLALPSSFSGFIRKPWTIVTYGFTHKGFLHILLNLISLYYIGELFRVYFTTKQVLTFYILGTILGGIIYLLSFNFIPVFRNSPNTILVGASAGISAIFIAIATYMPNYKVKIPLIGFVKLWVLAAIWIVLDIIQIPTGNAGGHLAHLGGALFGFLYVQKASNKKLNLLDSLKKVFIKKRSTGNFKTVHKTNKKSTYRRPIKSENQQKIDEILDKISKSGYDSLTSQEKKYLFQQGEK